MTSETQGADSPFKTIADVEKGVALLNKLLHRKDGLSAETFAGYFEKLHAHAAWSGVEALAEIADRIWHELDLAKGQEDLCPDTRHHIKKSLVTYKFLLHRKAEETDGHLEAAQ